MSAVAGTLGVSRSNLHDRLSGRTKPCRRYHKAQDAALLPLITALVAVRPSYGYRRITAVLNRQLRARGLAPANHKRVYRIMQANSLLLARKHAGRSELARDGKVVVMRSNLRWCSDGFEFSRNLAKDVHAVLVLDRAGWHGARALTVPANITLVPLPPYSPELNPVERI